MRNLIRVPLIVLLSIGFAATLGKSANAYQDDYDRLDGKGASGKRVDFIEWAGNLEIHVYPGKSLAGMGLKLLNDGGKKVMVIAYRFTNEPEKVITRRALVSIPFMPSFNIFKDDSVDEYDKYIITNQTEIAGDVSKFKLDAEPKSFFPEEGGTSVAGEPAGDRSPAEESKPAPAQVTAPPVSGVDEDGTIKANW